MLGQSNKSWAVANPGEALTSAIVSGECRGAWVASARRSGFLPLRAMQGNESRAAALGDVASVTDL
jgi:hypothetical protein